MMVDFQPGVMKQCKEIQSGSSNSWATLDGYILKKYKNKTA